MIKVFIDGSTGTTGLKLNDKLKKREDIEIVEISENLRKDPIEKSRIMNNVDVVFLCLQDKDAIESEKLVTNKNIIVIDSSTAHRTMEGWAYGFPELSLSIRKNIENSKRIAVSGCHASGVLSIIYPLIIKGIIGKDYPLTITSLTGYSGGGKKSIEKYKSDDIYLKVPKHYALGQTHKHLKEIVKIAGLKYEPCFSPIIDDYYSGMTVSVPLFSRLMNKKLTVYELRNLYKEYYKESNFIEVEENETENISPLINVGTNNMTIFVCGNDERMVVYSSFDNLGKGASGGALQCMNIALSIDETKGLKG